MPQLRRHRLDDDFLGVEDAVDDDAEDLAADLRDHDETVVGRAGAEAQRLLQMNKRQQFVAQPQHRRVLDPLDAVLAAGAGAHQLEHRELRDGEALAADLDDERRDDRQRQRNLDREGGADAEDGLEIDRTADLLDIGAHHVEADATPGNIGHLRRGGEAGQEDEIADLGLGFRGDLGFGGKTALDRPCLDAGDIEAAAVVADLDDDVTALVASAEPDRALLRLADGKPLGGALDAHDRRSCAPDGSAGP